MFLVRRLHMDAVCSEQADLDVMVVVKEAGQDFISMVTYFPSSQQKSRAQLELIVCCLNTRLSWQQKRTKWPVVRKWGKKGITAVDDSSARPSSQIPGLGHCTDTRDEKRAHGRRTGVVETDSDYVKLAKQGGQQGLLRHEASNLQSKPNLDYTAPDWFSFESNPQEHQSTQKRTIPDFMTSEEFQRSPTKGSFQPLAAPFGTDNKTTWEREGDNFTSDKDKNTTMIQPVSQMENLSLTSENHHQASKFKKTSSQKSDKPVSMQKLLSFGYADDWHVEHDKKILKENPSIEVEPQS